MAVDPAASPNVSTVVPETMLRVPNIWHLIREREPGVKRGHQDCPSLPKGPAFLDERRRRRKENIVFSREAGVDLETLADLRRRLIKAACFLRRTNVVFLRGSKAAAACLLLSAQTQTPNLMLFWVFFL